MTIARLSLSVLLAFAVAGAGVTFNAVPAHAGAGDKKAAKKAFKKGKKLYKAGDYKGALPLLLEANRLDPNPTLVKNITKTYEKMDEVPKAAAFLQGVLDAQRPKKAIKWAEKKLGSFKGVLDELKAKELAAAKSKAAEEAKSKAEAEAKKREEQLKAQQAEEDKKRQEEEARRREEHEKKRKAAIEANKVADEQAGTKRLIAYSAAGVALAAIGSGVTFGLQALSAQDEANKCAKDPAPTGGTCPKATYDGHFDDKEKAALLADVSWVVAGAGGVAAAVFYLMAEGEKSSAPAIPPPYDELGAEETEGADDDGAQDDGDGGEDKASDNPDDQTDDGKEEKKDDKEPKPESKPESKDDDGDSAFFVGPTGLFGIVGTF